MIDARSHSNASRIAYSVGPLQDGDLIPLQTTLITQQPQESMEPPGGHIPLPQPPNNGFVYVPPVAGAGPLMQLPPGASYDNHNVNRRRGKSKKCYPVKPNPNVLRIDDDESIMLGII
jgi:hypothetical protein